MKRVRDQLLEGARAMPRAVPVVVAIGLLLSLAAFALNRGDWEASADLEWMTVEEIAAPPPAPIDGGGRIELARTTLSAIPATERGELLFRVSGVLLLDRPDDKATARCDVSGPSSTRIARTPNLRAAWPRPSEDLRIQEVPDLMVVDFSDDGAELLGLPVRDSFRRYTDSPAPISVGWDGFSDRQQNWIWSLPRGTGAGPATLGFAVVFKTYRRPATRIVCRSAGTSIEARGEQLDWPVPDPESGF